MLWFPCLWRGELTISEALGRPLSVQMVIDHLGSGGAERQFCMLANQLKERGFDVSILIFQPNTFSADLLRHNHIPISILRPRNAVHLAFLMRAVLSRKQPHVVISFLKWSSLMVELAGAFNRRFSVIVSERILDVSDTSIVRYLRCSAHVLADAVVCNSYAQKKQLAKTVSWLDDRVSVIVNGVDLHRFRPPSQSRVRKRKQINMLVLARYAAQKNPFGLLDAVVKIRQQDADLKLMVDWYGHLPEEDLSKTGRLAPHYRSEQEASAIHQGMASEIAKHGLQYRFRLHGAQKDVVSLYTGCDVVCLPSFFEGCSNVIGEALACGVPVLASNVSDNGRFIVDGRTGFLFDPTDSLDIARAVRRFAALSDGEIGAMRLAGRQVAERKLAPSVLGDRFADLIFRLVSDRSARGRNAHRSKVR